MIKIGQLEAEIFDTLVLGSGPIDIYSKKLFFQFSSHVATDSLRCVIKFINTRWEKVTLDGICTAYPQKPFFWAPRKTFPQ